MLIEQNAHFTGYCHGFGNRDIVTGEDFEKGGQRYLSFLLIHGQAEADYYKFRCNLLSPVPQLWSGAATTHVEPAAQAAQPIFEPDIVNLWLIRL
jgi:hypothetical protein